VAVSEKFWDGLHSAAPAGDQCIMPRTWFPKPISIMFGRAGIVEPVFPPHVLPSASKKAGRERPAKV
jgi:hypothetical protein